MKLPIYIGAVALIVAVLIQFFLFDAYPLGINLLLAEAAFLGAVGFLSWKSERTLPPRAWIAGAFALLYSAAFAMWTSELTLALTGFGFFVANLFFVIFALGYKSEEPHPFYYFGRVGRTVGHLFERLHILSEMRTPHMSSRTNRILTGVVIALPILVIFTALFASADSVFDSGLARVGDWLENWLDLNTLIGRGFFIGFLFFLFLTAFAGIFWKRFDLADVLHQKGKGTVESAVVLTLVNVLFGIFLAVQGVYLFGGQAYLEKMGMTYSEYAVSGFYELMVVVSLVYFLIVSLRYFHGEKTKKLLLGLHAALLGQSGLILVSALMRMNLYVDAYGYTPSRIFGYVYMLTAAAILLFALVNILLEKAQGQLVRETVVLLGTSVLIFALLSPDALSMKLNIQRATQEGVAIDVYDLSRLSADAYPVFLQAYQSGVPMSGAFYGDRDTSRYCERMIQPREGEERAYGWRSWNVSRNRYCLIRGNLPPENSYVGAAKTTSP